MNEEFNKLINIIKTLLGPHGCLWDKKQNFNSLKYYLLEETYEVIEAINENSNQKISEELADLFFNVMFLIFVGENEDRFLSKDVIKNLNEKLIRRHPHVFANLNLKTEEEIGLMWERVKKEEESHSNRNSRIDGISEAFPALFKASKLLKKQKDAPDTLFAADNKEEEIANKLWAIVKEAKDYNVDPELALLALISKKEVTIREWEQENKKTGDCLQT